jgi:hypothetical protein
VIPIRLAATLGAAAVLLFGWNRVKESYRDEGRQECRDAAAIAYKENTDELFRIAAKARATEAKNAADASAARSAADRLRGAVAGNGFVIRSSAAAGSSPATQTELVSSELLSRVEELARFADASSAAGEACVSAYEQVRR